MDSTVQNNLQPTRDDQFILTVMPNPFDKLDGRRIFNLPASDATLDMLIEQADGAIPDESSLDDLLFIHNGVLRSYENITIQPGDALAIKPRIKGDAGRVIAMVVVAVAAAYTGGLAAGLYASAMGVSSTSLGAVAAGALASTAVTIGGMMLVNGLMPPTAPKWSPAGFGNMPGTLGGGSGSMGSQNYAWGGPQNSWQPGQIVPVLYGEHLIAGQVINYYLTTNEGNGDQTVHMLMAMCHGECQTPVQSADDIWIDNEFRLSALSSYKFDTTAGTESQAALEGFEQLHQYSPHSLKIVPQLVLLVSGMTYSPLTPTDQSYFARTVTTNSTTYGAVGCNTTTVVKLRNNNEYIATAASDYQSFKADLFTVGLIFDTHYSGSMPTGVDIFIMGEYTDASNYWWYGYNYTGGTLYNRLVIRSNGTTHVNVTDSNMSGGTPPSCGSYPQTAIEFCRTSDNEFRLYRNGGLIWSMDAGDIEMPDSGGSNGLRVGYEPNITSYGCWMDYDCFFVFKGRCLHEEEFTAPSGSGNYTEHKIDVDSAIVLKSGSMDEAKVHITFPNGLYEMNASGELIDRSCQVATYFKGENDPGWRLTYGKYYFHSGLVGGDTYIKAGGSCTFGPGYYIWGGCIVDVVIESGAWASNNAAGYMIVQDLKKPAHPGNAGDMPKVNPGDTVFGGAAVPYATISSTASQVINGHKWTAAQRTPVRKEVDVVPRLGPYVGADPYMPDGKWQIQCVRISEEDDESKYSSDVYIAGTDEILDYELTYPNISLLGVHILASGRLSGAQPNISAVWNRGNISIPNYNGVGTQTVASNIPAYAAIDIITNANYGLGADIGYVDETTFEALKTWNTGTVDGNVRNKVNGIFDTAIDVRQALDMIGIVGRAKFLQTGMNFYALIEKPVTQRMHNFTEGNRFDRKGERTIFIRNDIKPHIYEIEFFNKDKDYQQDKVRILCPGFDALAQVRPPETIQLWGCTTEDEAKRFGLLKMQMTYNLKRTTSLEMDVEAIPCEMGDVFSFQRRASKEQFGGRLPGQSSTGSITTIILDKAINLPSSLYGDGNGKFIVTCGTDDSIQEALITGPYDTDTTLITVASGLSGFETTSTYRDSWMITHAEETVFDFRMTSLARTQDTMFEIEAIEYKESVYYHSAYGSGSTAI